MWRKSPCTTATFDAESRRRTRAASGRVSTPRPGPISTNSSSSRGSIARMTFATHAGSRKCWPKRRRARPSVLRIVVVQVVVGDAAPVLVLDLLNLLLAHPEVVADLVNERDRKSTRL